MTQRERYYWYNDSLLPCGTPCLMPDDRGFRFGDGVFETIAVHYSTLYQWELHMHRLVAGLSVLRIDFDTEHLFKKCFELIEKNGVNDGFIRISISRGVGSQGYLPAPNIIPTLIIETIERSKTPTASCSLYLSCHTKPSRTAYPTHLKTAQGINSTLALLEAQEHGYDNALLLNHDGYISETASGNLFWIKGDQLYTPSLECDCLDGTTRASIIRFASVNEVEAPLEHLELADAVFMTNCTVGITPITRLAPYGWQWPDSHPFITTLHHQRQKDIDAECRNP